MKEIVIQGAMAFFNNECIGLVQIVDGKPNAVIDLLDGTIMKIHQGTFDERGNFLPDNNLEKYYVM